MSYEAPREGEKGGQVSGAAGVGTGEREGPSGETPGIFRSCQVSPHLTSVDFVMLVRGRSLWAPAARPFVGTRSHVLSGLIPDSVDNRTGTRYLRAAGRQAGQ